MIAVVRLALQLIAFVLNVFTLVMCFDFKYGLSRVKVMLILIACSIAAIPLQPVLDTLPSAFLQMLSPFSYIFLIPVCIMARGSFLGKVYFFFAQQTVAFIMTLAAGLSAELFFVYNSETYWLAWFCTGLAFYAVYAVFIWRYGRRLCSGLLSYINTPLWGAFAFLPYISFLVIKNLYFTPVAVLPVGLQIDAGFLMMPIFILVGVVMLTASILISQKRIVDQSEIRLAQGALSAGHDYYDKLTRLSERIHTMRHDYKYHLAIIQKLLNSGNSEDAKNYLDKLGDDITETEVKEYCKSNVINALIDSFEQRCKQENISFSTEIELAGKLGADDYELCIILGNMLENAIAACAGTPDGNSRYIDLVMKHHGNQYGIMVQNSFDGQVKMDGDELISTKQGRAQNETGFGISSIKAIAKRHGGGFYPEWDDNTFTAYVVIKMQNTERQHAGSTAGK